MSLTNINHAANGRDNNDKTSIKSFQGIKNSQERDIQHTNSKCSCCIICCSRLYSCCKPCMTKYNTLPEGSSRSQRCKHAFLCPPHGKLAKILTLVLCLLLVWGTCVALLGSTALPGGNLFGIFVLFVLCVLGGELASVMRLPPLLGKFISSSYLNCIIFYHVCIRVSHSGEYIFACKLLFSISLLPLKYL